MKWYHILGASLVGVWLYVMFVMKPGGAKVTPPSAKPVTLLVPPVRSGGADVTGIASGVNNAHKV